MAVTEPLTQPARLRWQRRLRLIPLAFAVASMGLGLWLGLARLGLMLPGGMPERADLHGLLMISGFLGTLISLERAVALGAAWAYAAPALSSAGVLGVLTGRPFLGAAAFLAAAAALWLVSIVLATRQVALFTVVLAVAPLCWAAGTAAWLLGASAAAATGWWLSFLILTIAAERLELSRLVSPPRVSQLAFAALMLALLIGSARGELAAGWAPFTAAGLVGSAAWLLHYDIARRTIRIAGQPRFSACAILAGHGWLAVAGVLLLAQPAAFTYDAVVHAIAIGFVLSMVLGHAPIILPAVTGARIRLSAWAFAPLVLLHASVIMRVTGDLGVALDLRQISGLVTVLALAGYAAVLAIASVRRHRSS
jgi:hypothetical protein